MACFERSMVDKVVAGLSWEMLQGVGSFVDINKAGLEWSEVIDLFIGERWHCLVAQICFIVKVTCLERFDSRLAVLRFPDIFELCHF